MNWYLAKLNCIYIGLLAVPLSPGVGVLCAQNGLTAVPPAYTTNSIVNAASQSTGSLAPYTIATVYGTDLSYTTRAVGPADLVGGSLPNNLDGVQVLISGVPAPLFFVSPGQINFLIPPEFLAGNLLLAVSRSGLAGAKVPIHLDNFAPGFFLYNGNMLVSTHADGGLITTASPAHTGEIVVLYATGLGPTTPQQVAGRLYNHAATIAQNSPLQVVFDGSVSPPEDIFYAGITPGFAGLYQINVRVPVGCSAAPVVQITFGTIVSPLATMAAVVAH